MFKFCSYLEQDIACMIRLVVSPALLLSQAHPKTPWANIFFQQKPLGTQGKANRVTFLAQISTLSSIVKIFKLDFLKKPSPKKFETQDLNWSFSTCKKLLKHFFRDIFLFQDISEDMCVKFIQFRHVQAIEMICALRQIFFPI